MLIQIFSLILLYVLGVAIAMQWYQYQADRAICHQPVNYGNCGVKVNAWYYNPLQKACLRFVYALCGGNKNRFYTKGECEKLCLRNWYQNPKIIYRH